MSRTESIEIERKYDVGELVRVPDLAGVGPVERAEVDEPFTLRAVYYDTAEHLLLANRVTLRRREGGHDEGWHVKLPAGAGARREVHSPLGADRDEDLPSTLRRVVEVILRGRPVHPVLVLTTKRTVTRLLDGDGHQLAELADDEVTAADPDTASVRSWREWEVELAPDIARTDGEALQDSVAEALERAGASVSSSKSKLARGLGDRATGGGLSEPIALAPAEVEKGSAAEFVIGAVSRLTGDLVAIDPAVREGDDDAVHRFRTTLRRLRSVLRVYRGALPDDDAGWFDESLQNLGRLAGVGRDLEVRLELLDYYASAADDGRVTHETLRRLHDVIDEAARDASADLARALDDPAYFELLDRLEAVPVTEPEGDRADDDAATFVADAIARETRRTHKRVRIATRDLSAAGGVPTDSIHAARKAARRLRYALEAAKAGGARGTSSQRKAARTFQDVVGDALDAARLSEWVAESADRARRADEDTFGYGVLSTLAAADRDDSLAGLRKAAKKL